MSALDKIPSHLTAVVFYGQALTSKFTLLHNTLVNLLFVFQIVECIIEIE